MNAPICYLNGVLLPLSGAAVSADDGGLLYGDGLFETMRIYAARPFLLERHLQRLQEGAAFLDIPLPGLRELTAAVEQVIRANAVQEGSLRITLTGGAGRYALWPRSLKEGPTILITVRDTVPYPDHLYSRGCRAGLVGFPRNEASPLVKIKSLNFLENILGKREAARQGVDEGLFLNTRDELTEGAASNLFLFDGKTLMTPSALCGLLPGTTRGAVLHLARETMGVPVEERVLYREDLEQAAEAFLTASIMEIMPLIEVAGRKIGAGAPGPLSQALLVEYRRRAYQMKV
jgi:branched-subunit amino acid aminotransferase/4-amino-4-deoxychorismate lyase